MHVSHLHVLKVDGLNFFPDVVPGSVVDKLSKKLEGRVGAEGVCLGEVEVVYKQHTPFAYGRPIHSCPKVKKHLSE